jgi:hypothetical protein
VFNHGFFFRIAFGIISVFMPTKIKQRMRVCPDLKTVTEYIDLARFPSDVLPGTGRYNYDPTDFWQAVQAAPHGYPSEYFARHLSSAAPADVAYLAAGRASAAAAAAAAATASSGSE